MLHVSRQKLLKQSVEHVSSAKFLGVYIDLTFNQECHKESTGTCKTNLSIFVPIKGIYLVVIFSWLPSAPTRRGGEGGGGCHLSLKVAMVTRYQKEGNCIYSIFLFSGEGVYKRMTSIKERHFISFSVKKYNLLHPENVKLQPWPILLGTLTEIARKICFPNIFLS